MNSNTLCTGCLLQNGKYSIIKVLGQGGFGITYLAEQTALGRRVAVKEFFMKDHCNRDGSSSEVSVPSTGSRELVGKFRQKFLREARMIATLDNPHIVRIHDVFEENGTAYYVMEHLGGGSLSEKVRQSGPMPQAEALNYIRQVADALAYLHGRNILHFDIKPSNILLGQSGQAVLIDFGISKHYDEAGSQTSSTPVGLSKGYAPLEQYQQSELSTFTPATDIYSLGATLYFLLIGQTPPSASEVNEDGLPPLPGGIDAAVRKAIVKAMAPRRKNRPQSVREFLRLLDAAPGPAVEDREDEDGEETLIHVIDTEVGNTKKRRKREDYIAPITYAGALKSACKNIFNFSGRANRCEFWCAGMTLLPFCLLILFCGMDNPPLEYVRYVEHTYVARFFWNILVCSVVLLLTLSLEIRRLHDCGRSGWWALGFNLPFVLLIIGTTPIALQIPFTLLFSLSLLLSLYVVLKFFLAPSKEEMDRRKAETR